MKARRFLTGGRGGRRGIRHPRPPFEPRERETDRQRQTGTKKDLVRERDRNKTDRQTHGWTER